MLEKEIIYMVQLDYSTDDCNGIDNYLFNTKEKALDKFYSLIKLEKEYYKKEYSYIDDFELDTNIEDKDANEYWWNYTCQSNYYLHTFIDLKIMEVN